MTQKNGGTQGPGTQFTSHPFKLSIEEVAAQLNTSTETGLTKAAAAEALKSHGENKLHGDGGVKWTTVLLKQVSNAMILVSIWTYIALPQANADQVLLLAMAVSYGVMDWIEAGVITAVIILNITIGFFQEFSAEKKMDSLRALSSPSATLLRDGESDTIPSAQVVPGDIVILKTGDTIPADLRLFETMNLECDEKILTGEAMPVAKEGKIDVSELDVATTAIGDRVNMAYSSSTVTKGRGRGIVVSTGMHTEIGKIAQSMSGKVRKANRSMSRSESKFQPVKGFGLRAWDAIGAFLGLTTGTPLQRKLNKLAYLLFFCAIILAIIVFAVNKFNVTNEVVIYAISTGKVSRVPNN